MNRSRVVVVGVFCIYSPAALTRKLPVKPRSVSLSRGWKGSCSDGAPRKDLLDKTVYNDQQQKIGEINDIIITPKNFVSYAIIGVGGFSESAGTTSILMEQIQKRDKNLVLPGATKAALKSLPKFEYAKKK